MALSLSASWIQQLTTSPAKTLFPGKLILRNPGLIPHPLPWPPSLSFSKTLLNPVRASPPQKYTYPDPIPDFAEAETQKFRAELSKKLSKDKETFGDDLDTVVEVCAELNGDLDGGMNEIDFQYTSTASFLHVPDNNPQIFGDFLHKEYGGPGTLLVEPFTDMLVALKERNLPGAPLAVRTSLLWAQSYVDQDWEIWNSNPAN